MHGPDRSERIWVFGPFQVFHQWPRPKMLRLLSVISSASFIIIAAANSENRTFLKKKKKVKIVLLSQRVALFVWLVIDG
jgi:hypothetical protein